MRCCGADFDVGTVLISAQPSDCSIPLRYAREYCERSVVTKLTKSRFCGSVSLLPPNMSDTDADWIFYGYVGSKAAAVVMAVAFGVALIGHTFLTFRSKAFYVRPASFSRQPGVTEGSTVHTVRYRSRLRGRRLHRSSIISEQSERSGWTWTLSLSEVSTKPMSGDL